MKFVRFKRRCPGVVIGTFPLPESLPLLMVCCLAFLVGLAPARGTDTNIAAPPLRPFYIIGHNADTLEIARNYLVSGANALEADVNILADHPGLLRIGHGPSLGSGPTGGDSLTLTNYLKDIHDLAREHTNLCLVYFDCKSLAATPELGQTLLADIRTCLIGRGEDSLPLNVIISIGKLRDKAIFSHIADKLGPREGLMIDGDSDPAAVAEFFESAKICNRCYANGTVPFNTFLSHFVVSATVKESCQMRDADHKFSFVATWTVNNPGQMRHFIKMGVDSISVDQSFFWYNFSWYNLGNGLRSLTGIVQNEGPSLGIRLATRGDNPFRSRSSPEAPDLPVYAAKSPQPSADESNLTTAASLRSSRLRLKPDSAQ